MCDAHQGCPVDFSAERAEGIGLAGMEGGHTSLHVLHTMELSSLWHLGEEAFPELVFGSEM